MSVLVLLLTFWSGFRGFWFWFRFKVSNSTSFLTLFSYHKMQKLLLFQKKFSPALIKIIYFFILFNEKPKCLAHVTFKFSHFNYSCRSESRQTIVHLCNPYCHICIRQLSRVRLKQNTVPYVYDEKNQIL